MSYGLHPPPGGIYGYKENKMSTPDDLPPSYENKQEVIEKKEIYNTDVKTKAEYWPVFAKLIENQFMHGGDKYAMSPGKEMTDLICEKYPGKSGVDWVLGTIEKYCGRYKNFEREKDLLKIVTFAYIIWLKKGYHLKDIHDEDTNKT